MAGTMRAITGAVLGAAGMYYFDAASGRRRRALLRDRLVSTATGLDDALEVAGRDLAHRLRGVGARTRHLFGSDHPSDEVLVERVRSSVGRAVSHPGAIEVQAHDGRVVLGGPVLASEHEQLLRVVRSVRGVREVEDQLAVHSSPDGISALQGGHPRQPPRFELLQGNWSPAARLVIGLAGGLLVLAGIRSRGPLGMLGAATGGLALARSTTNVPLRRLAGGSGRRAVDIRKTINVRAPVQQVFETLARYESFPAFMRNVREVRRHEDGRSHWVVAGPAGASVEWDSVTTAFEPNRVLAWRTVPDSTVEHAGIIRFEPFDGGTRLDVRMSYNPPAGALGHLVAKLFGADPKKELDEDLLRLKTFLESGKPPRDAAAAHHGRVAAPTETAAPSRH